MPTAVLATTTDYKISSQPVCFHCGETCRDEHILFDQKDFCCAGCKMVYEILNTNDLCAYYQIEKNAGISLKGKKLDQYAFLDDEEVTERLIDFSNGEISKITFHLPQIHCASCIWLLENLWKLNEGIQYSKVNFLKKEIYLTYRHDQTSLRKIVELLASIGYTPAINLQSLDETGKKVVDRSFYYKLGVAGFAFGNIMLMSFPEYLGLERDQGSFFQQLFGYLNILLSIPVLTYSGRDYFISAWGSLRYKELNLDVPIAFGMIALFARSVYEILSHTGAGYLDSFAGLIFFLLIGKWFQQRTYHHLSFERDYKSYFPIAATVRREGTTQTVSLDKLALGDLVILKHGELIPADCILVKGRARVDYSFVTGESEPVEKKKGEKLFAGGRQMGEAIEVNLIKKVSQSYLTQLWNDDAFQSAQKSSTSKLADLIGRRFTFVVLTVAFGTLIYWLPQNASVAFQAFTAVLIIACPCAVALSIPFTLGNAIRVLAKNNLYLKNTQVIEDLKDVTAVVFDKTGTLTNALQSRIVQKGAILTARQRQMFRSLAGQSNHPLSRQLHDFLKDGSEDLPVAGFFENTGAGVEGKVEGVFLRLGSAAFLNQKTAGETEVFLEMDGTVSGSFVFQNEYRNGIEKNLFYFQKNYKTFLLSGDNDREKENLSRFFENADSMHFNQSPQDKLDFIKELQRKGEKVLMFGDGLNDAGALQKSDVGIVLTENTNNFTPASDGILSAARFQQIPSMIEFSKSSVRLVHWAYLLAFCYNLVGLSYAVTGTLSPVVAAILMPASSVTIVLFGVGMSNLLARKNLVS